jgi:hypothetical protein
VATTKYSDLFQYVLPELVGCSTMLAEMQLRAAVIDLCRRAKVWAYEDDPTTTSPGERNYDLSAPAGSTIVEVKAMFVDGDAVDPASTNFDNPAVLGKPETFRQLTPEAFVLWPTPDTEYPLTMELTLAPSRASSGFPSWIAEKYHDAIVAGAKSRLMLMPGNPWTNLQIAAAYRSLFESEVGTASMDNTTSFARTRLRTTTQH